MKAVRFRIALLVVVAVLTTACASQKSSRQIVLDQLSNDVAETCKVTGVSVSNKRFRNPRLRERRIYTTTDRPEFVTLSCETAAET